MLEKGLVLTGILLTLNAFLLVSGVLVNHSTSAGQLFGWTPSGLHSGSSYTKESDFDINMAANPNFSGTSSQQATDPNFLTVAVDFAKSVFGFIKDIPVYISKLAGLIGQLLFGFVFFMKDIGLPDILIWAVGIPLALIELITVAYLVMQALSSVGGVFGK